MGERTSYAPGTFSWAELATSDQDAAKAFYTTLFGWTYDDRPLGDGQTYSMAQRDGSNVAAIFNSEQPPHWNCYVTVASVEDATARAAEAGATVVAEPFDVFTAGRMSVIKDPTGAVLSLWQAGENIGASLVNTPGAMTWNDLVTPEPQIASEFYGKLFGWTTEDVGQGYRVISNNGRSNGGIVPLDPRMGDAPANWMPYFGHADVDGLLREFGDLGGHVLNGPMQMPAGKIAVVRDPQGAVFAVWTGEYDD
jgi:predicted enzyme related to lactoylglutathione lyase